MVTPRDGSIANTFQPPRKEKSGSPPEESSVPNGNPADRQKLQSTFWLSGGPGHAAKDEDTK